MVYSDLQYYYWTYLLQQELSYSYTWSLLDIKMLEILEH